MEMEKINILVNADAGGMEHKQIDAYRIGALAVHQHQTNGYESDEWVITSAKHGTKFPGRTMLLKAAIACAKELDEMFTWETYDAKKNKAEALKAKEIIASWGLDDFEFFS